MFWGLLGYSHDQTSLENIVFFFFFFFLFFLVLGLIWINPRQIQHFMRICLTLFFIWEGLHVSSKSRIFARPQQAYVICFGAALS